MESIISFFTGPSVEDQIKEIHRIMDDAIRDIKREAMTLKRERNKTIIELRQKAATSNKTSSKELKMLAIRCRRQENQMNKLEGTIDNIRNFKSMANQLRTNEALKRAFTKMTTAMTSLNACTSTFQLCALINQYERQNLLMQERQEFIDEKIEEAYEDSEDEEEMADQILEEVLDELNIQLTGDLPTTSKVVVTPKTTEATKNGEEDILASRIKNL